MTAGAHADVLARLVLRRSGVPAVVPGPVTAEARGVQALAHFWVGDFEACFEMAQEAAALARTPRERVLATAALGLAAAGWPEAAGLPAWDAALTLLDDHDRDDDHGDGDDWSFARYLLAEAALDCARLDVAGRAADGASWSTAWAGHPYEVMMLATEVRVAAFAGRIDDALVGLERLRQAAESHGLGPMASAVEILLTGNADRAEQTQALIDDLVAAHVEPRDYLGRGVYLLASYGAISLGDVEQSAALLLAAQDDAELSHLTIIDRAIGLELLAHAAIVADDADAAQAWLEVAATLQDHPVAAPAVARLRARAALHVDDVATAVHEAGRAVNLARAQDRGIEAAEGAILLARARIAADQLAEASRGLRQEVVHSDQSGHLAVRRSAAHVLGAARRRLPPRTTGEWSVLSAREREVAELVLSGLDTRAVARELFLSPATVRTHLSRVLCAFGVSSRVGLLAVAGPRGVRARPTRDLTPRQGEVVALVAQGHDNTAVAALLGLSVKGVEKHVGDALRRWDAVSRFDLALLWLDQHGSDGGDRS